MTGEKSRLDLVSRAAALLESQAAPTLPALDEVPAAQIARPEAAPAETQPPAASPPVEAQEEAGAQTSSRAPMASVELDFAALHKDGFLTPHNQKSVIAEEFRIVKRPLLRVAFDKRNAAGTTGHVIMVTSAHPGDGKTFTAINLAFSMASERDLFVLLIDGDIRRRGLSRKLGIDGSPGIMDVLMNPKLSISDVMIRTNVPNLAVIPSGIAIESATELFASQRMTTLVRDVASRYPDRLIIFDTPPVLAASEAGVLALHVGQILFVINSGVTSKRAITDSLKLVNTCPNINLVINRVSRASGGEGFGVYDY